MPDNVLRVGAEFDVSPIVAGAQGAITAFDKVQASAAKMAAQLIADGESFTSATSALTNFGFSAQTVAAAMESLGIAEKEIAVSTEAVAATMGGLERQMAAAGGRAAGMFAGLGMLGGALGRIAGYLPGLGEAFVLALPVFLVADIVEKFDEFRDKIEKAGRASQELATNSFHVADAIQLENLKLEDQIAKLEHRPEQNKLREALIEDQEAAETLTKDLAESAQKANDLLTVGAIGQLFSKASGDEAGAHERLQPILNDIAKARNELAQAPAGSAAAKAAIQEQIDLYEKLNHQLDLEILAMEAAGTRHGKFIDADSIANLQNFQTEVINTTRALSGFKTESDLRIKLGGLEETKAVDDFWKEYSVGFEKAAGELAKHDEMWKKFFAERAAEAKKSADERAKIEEEGSKQIMEQTDRAYAEMVTSNIDQVKAEATQIEEVYRKMSEQKEAGETGHAGMFLDVIKIQEAKQQMQELDTEISKTEEIIARLKSEMALIANQPFISEADQTQLNRYNEELKSLETMLQKLEADHTKLQQSALSTWQQIGKAEETALTSGFNTFNQQFTKMLETGQSFTKVMIAAWNSMVSSVIQQILKMGEQWLIEHVIMAAISKAFGVDDGSDAATTKKIATATATVNADAAQSAADVFLQAIEAIPFPANLAAAPALASAAHAEALSVAAFDIGGVVPGMGAIPAIVHGGERVLTGAQNQTLERIANSTTSNYGNTNVSMENHFHGAGSVSEAAIARNLSRGIRRGLIPMRGR